PWTDWRAGLTEAFWGGDSCGVDGRARYGMAGDGNERRSAGRAVRGSHAAAEPGVHRCGRADARARDRAERRRVQRGARPPVPATARRGRGAAARAPVPHVARRVPVRFELGTTLLRCAGPGRPRV